MKINKPFSSRTAIYKAYNIKILSARKCKENKYKLHIF